MSAENSLDSRFALVVEEVSKRLEQRAERIRVLEAQVKELEDALRPFTEIVPNCDWSFTEQEIANARTILGGEDA
jgi:hypothetical protein